MGMLRSPDLGGIPEANQLKKQNTKEFAELLYAGLELPPPIERPQLFIDPSSVQRMRGR